MATEKQIAANRRNAAKSTGPKTDQGKRRSRRNAFRHGLTAETIIDLVEDSADYEAFEAEIKADYQPRGALEHELVVRLASLIWRLRRATAVESGLFAIQVGIVQERRSRTSSSSLGEGRLDAFYRLAPPLAPMQQFDCEGGDPDCQKLDELQDDKQARRLETVQSSITHSFLRLTNLESRVFERLGRYETRLWRHIVQTIFLIESLKRGVRKPRSSNRRACSSASFPAAPSNLD